MLTENHCDLGCEGFTEYWRTLYEDLPQSLMAGHVSSMKDAYHAAICLSDTLGKNVYNSEKGIK